MFQLPVPGRFAVVAFALIGGATAHAAALVGVTSRVQVAPSPAPALDMIKQKYRQPDAIPFPADDPYTPEKALLGRVLFNDARLSGTGALSCASCHNPGFSYGDGRAKGIGNDMRSLDRRSPSIINSAWGELYMWDGRADTLELQALGPIQAPTEMDQSLAGLVGTLSAIPGYATLFAAAFPHRPITPSTVASAIATYERTVVSASSPIDAWIGGDEHAIPGAAKRGFDLFNTKGGCASCHGGWTFTDEGFHDTGLPDDDLGRGRLFPHVLKMQHAFKTPGLRETARRGPYMHDGSLPTLAAVVAHYNQGAVDRPSRSELIGPLGLSADEQADLVAFLQTLTSSVRLAAVPALPR